jgi:transcriptional regulator with XRE-family HTH domain
MSTSSLLNATFGQRLRQARKAVHLTQENLAFEAGLDRTYISMLERGKQCPTIIVLFQLCKAMSIEPAAFIANIYRDIQHV